MPATKNTAWMVTILVVTTVGGWSMYFIEKKEHKASGARQAVEVESQKQQVASLMARAAELRDAAEQSKVAIAQIRSERTALAKQLQTGKSERERLDQVREQIRNNLIEVESERKRMEAERDQLRDELAGAESEQGRMEAERDQLRDELAGAESEQGRIETERDQLRDELAGAESEQGRMEAERDQLRDELYRAESEIERIEAEREQLRNNLIEAESKQRRLAENPEEMGAQLQTIKTDQQYLAGERIRLSGDLISAKNERDRLAAELDEMLETRELLSNDLQKTREERDRLQLNLDQQIQFKETELASSTSRVEDLGTRLGEAGRKIDQLQAEVEVLIRERDDANSRFSSLQIKLESELQSRNVEIEQLKNNRTVIRVAGDILFDAGSAILSEAGRAALGHIAAALVDFPVRQISLEGHTDAVPISETLQDRFATNWELSVARAASAVRYLQLKGINPERLRAVGYGEYRPVADNDDPQLRGRNRRLEIRLLPVDETVLEQDLSATR